MSHIAIFPLKDTRIPMVLGLRVDRQKTVDACRRVPSIRVVDGDLVQWDDSKQWVFGSDQNLFAIADRELYNEMLHLALDMADLTVLSRHMDDEHHALLSLIWSGRDDVAERRFARASVLDVEGSTPQLPTTASNEATAPECINEPALPTQAPRSLNPTMETIYEDEDLDLATDPLVTAISSRVLMLTPTEAALADKAYTIHGLDWHKHCGSLKDKWALSPLVTRERAVFPPTQEIVDESKRDGRGNIHSPSMVEIDEICGSGANDAVVQEAHEEIVPVARNLGTMVASLLAGGDRGYV